ncbi:hypothetical protein J1614_001879 [Plenodomus biglobosus]|nr:hypothetical protein J1614_001879 [Plenodomus biglobosus]
MAQSPVHILGLGNLGKLLAHSLRKQHPELPITLLFHRPSLLDEWNRAGKCIEIVRGGNSDRQNGFTHEDVSHSGSLIRQLIVATKTHATVRALQSIKERLNSSSTLLFLQNGIGKDSVWYLGDSAYKFFPGTIDEVNTHIFLNVSTRPRYLAGIFNHGVYATSTFSSVHAGVADAVIGPILSDDSKGQPNQEDPTKTGFAQDIASCPELSTSMVTAQELLYTQLQKLTINAVINPLTVIFDCKNGELFTDPTICALIEQQIVEISAVIYKIISSHTQPVDTDIITKFNPEHLRAVVFDVGRRTASNISSMRQDRLAGRTTEIDYINGYIVAQARKHGIPSPLNTRIVQLVKDEKYVSSGQIQEVFAI